MAVLFETGWIGFTCHWPLFWAKWGFRRCFAFDQMWSRLNIANFKSLAQEILKILKCDICSVQNLTCFQRMWYWCIQSHFVKFDPLRTKMLIVALTLFIRWNQSYMCVFTYSICCSNAQASVNCCSPKSCSVARFNTALNNDSFIKESDWHIEAEKLIQLKRHLIWLPIRFLLNLIELPLAYLLCWLEGMFTILCPFVLIVLIVLCYGVVLLSFRCV